LNSLPRAISESIQQKILADMNPSLVQVHGKFAIAVFIGSLISLAICGQFGMGMTSWAEILSHKIHQGMSPLACAAICGIAYAVFPTLILRLFLCSPVQFYSILKKRFLTLFAWHGVVGISLATFGDHGTGASEITFWIMAAIITSYITAAILKRLVPVWMFKGYSGFS
jgi:peptidoglycan/LPS O-acetylase OafA/YrhL